MKITRYLEKIPSLEGRLYIVTGANSGLGFDLSVHLATKGASVILACRNLERANKAKEKILSNVPNANLFIEEYDQASFDSIVKLKDEQKDTQKEIVNSVDLSVKIDDLYGQLDSLDEIVNKLSVMTNKKEIVKVLSDIKELLEKLKNKSREYDTSISNSQNNITLERLHKEKIAFLKRRKENIKDIC